VLDEIHIYRGVFGSHLTNVIRRLKRISKFYNAYPQFILTSATISQPKEFAEKLIEEKFELINNDCSPKNKKTFAFYNPPIINDTLGIRRSMFTDVSRIAETLLFEHIQTIIFARTRRTVENLCKRLNTIFYEKRYHIAPYRSGFLKSERRNIEARLKSGDLDMVVSTTALELGIDMGMVDAIVLLGYTGSISRFYQQAGRAGRKKSASICIMIASPAPIDEYIINNPEFLLGKSSESIQIDPDNVYILYNHIKCAAFELPFENNENFGSISKDILFQYLCILEGSGEVLSDRGKFYWRSTAYLLHIYCISRKFNLFEKYIRESPSINH